ncbi:uncharacterized protein LOC142498087 [Ascaphus truei]|uniref:uncharacterized protein LOC142498087 n=1 Tax=Ascaphus truei TaxID=8439 RepID=UPI003F5A8DD7
MGADHHILQELRKRERRACACPRSSQRLSDSDGWEEKEEKLRRAIKRVVKCDFTKANPLDPVVVPQADVLVSKWYLEAASKDHNSYLSNLKKNVIISEEHTITVCSIFTHVNVKLMLLLYIVAPEGHVSPEREQVSSPGSASSTHLEEHDEEDYDDDDDDDDDDAAAAAIDTQIQASDHEEVPIETVLPPKRPANTTYDAIVASEGKIVEAENRRHSDLMTVLERMIALQEETVSQLAHLHRVFIEVPKQLQKINTSFEALVVQQTKANYWRMTNVPQFNTSQAGSVHAGQFSPHSSDIHSPGPNVTGQVADIAVQVPDDILPLPSDTDTANHEQQEFGLNKQYFDALFLQMRRGVQEDINAALENLRSEINGLTKRTDKIEYSMASSAPSWESQFGSGSRVAGVKYLVTAWFCVAVLLDGIVPCS